MAYINSISSITNQKSFDNRGFSKDLISITPDKERLISPDYKKYIEKKLIRRMSNVLRMSVACSKKCLEDYNNEPEAIIVGTGLGCLTDTKKFLENFILIDGMLPPTAFIQSTHNTIAGQVSLAMKNHGYNMTHTQNTLSFEMALEDALLSLGEGVKDVLVGAADEAIPFLNEFFESLGIDLLSPLTTGATFCGLSSNKNSNSLAKIVDCQTSFGDLNVKKSIDKFLHENNTTIDSIDVVVYSNNYYGKPDVSFDNKSIMINDTCGVYATNSAFGMHIGADLIASGSAKNVLVVNNLLFENLGLILLEAV